MFRESFANYRGPSARKPSHCCFGPIHPAKRRAQKFADFLHEGAILTQRGTRQRFGAASTRGQSRDRAHLEDTIRRLLDGEPLISGDARGLHRARDGRDNGSSVWLILNQDKVSLVAVSGFVHDYLFADVGRPDKVSAACSWPGRGGTGVECPCQCKVIQLVRGASGLFPHAHAETAGGGSTARVHQFCSIAVPLDVSCVERTAEGSRRRESELPQAHD